MEDQHYNGDIWNHEAFALLKKFGWSRIGDYDMDLQGNDGGKMGIDTILKFETPLKNQPQLVILEAKRYETRNFNKSLLQDWIEKLDKKLIKLRNSEYFVEKFPDVDNCTIVDTGVIALWFSDIDNYNSFYPKFRDALAQISVSNRTRRAGVNKIYVIENTRFMRLFALYNAINNIEDKETKEFNFTYSPRYIDDNPITRQKVLTIECIFSDIIFAESRHMGEVTSYIFYFGQLNLNSFRLLKNAYSKTALWDKSIKIILYVYDADAEFRKIENDIKTTIFDGFTLQIMKMARNNNIPEFLLNLNENEQ